MLSKTRGMIFVYIHCLCNFDSCPTVGITRTRRHVWMGRTLDAEHEKAE